MAVDYNVCEVFSGYKSKKIALYGLAAETQRVLPAFEQKYEIVGLMDSFRGSGMLYGRQIISFEDAVRAGVALIVVVARPGSCRSIAKKIGRRCRENGIALMDVRGGNLLLEKKASFYFSGINGVTKAELKEKIKNATALSFDMFDTLVMRQTLNPDDVAEHVECYLQERGIYIDNFSSRRIAAEKELSSKKAPALIEIYQKLLEGLGSGLVTGINAEQLAALEWEIDFGLLVPREDMCEIFRKAASGGKNVYVVSDTYYSREQLVQILEKCGITRYTDILSSSDHGTGKTQGLFGILKDRERSKKCLHIGDDIVADIEGARNWGLDTCRICSSLELLESLGGMGIQDYEETLSDRLKIGMFAARIFNSPFQFGNGEQRLGIASAYDIGYLLCAPVICDFAIWFYDCMQEGRYHNIWFSARDGYLMKKLYGVMARMCQKKDESVYFLTSRIAAVRAGVQCEKDIQYVDEMKFSGTLEENLKERFGIEMDDFKGRNILKDENGLIKYKNLILEKSCRAYQNYQHYMAGLDIQEGAIAFFDFVAKGTIQMFVQRLTDHRLKGFYFLQLEKEQMRGRGLDIRAFYDESEADSCAIYNDYYILETVLTAPHPSVREFSEDGIPVYATETRTEKDIQCFGKAQEGIMDYFKTYIKLCPEAERTINKKLDESFLELVHKVEITDADFLGLVVEDSFFNRMTDMTDII